MTALPRQRRPAGGAIAHRAGGAASALAVIVVVVERTLERLTLLARSAAALAQPAHHLDEGVVLLALSRLRIRRPIATKTMKRELELRTRAEKLDRRQSLMPIPLMGRDSMFLSNYWCRQTRDGGYD